MMLRRPPAYGRLSGGLREMAHLVLSVVRFADHFRAEEAKAQAEFEAARLGVEQSFEHVQSLQARTFLFQGRAAQATGARAAIEACAAALSVGADALQAYDATLDACALERGAGAGHGAGRRHS